jgi:hypothetical protein
MRASRATTPASGTTPIYDAVVPSNPNGSNGAAISMDGNSVAYAGSNGLFIHNVKTGTDQLLLSQVSEVIDDLSNPAFSPDATHIVFSAGGGTWYYPADIYSIDTDGSGLTKLTTSTLPGQNAHDSEMFDDAIYSSDGTEVALVIDDLGSGCNYVGLVKSGTGEPERLAQGKPLFWANDGRGIYYTDTQCSSGWNGAVKLLDMQTRQIHTALGEASFLGQVLGSDTGFFAAGTSSITVTGLSVGTSVPGSLAALVARIPLQDNQGRSLTTVQAGGAGHLLLVYTNYWGEHLEVLKY